MHSHLPYYNREPHSAQKNINPGDLAVRIDSKDFKLLPHAKLNFPFYLSFAYRSEITRIH